VALSQFCQIKGMGSSSKKECQLIDDDLNSPITGFGDLILSRDQWSRLAII
jgi:hypothetical protein